MQCGVWTIQQGNGNQPAVMALQEKIVKYEKRNLDNFHYLNSIICITLHCLVLRND